MPLPPSEDNLVDELIAVRDQGIVKLRELHVPMLTKASRTVTLDLESPDHVVVEALLRRAVVRLGGGSYGDAAVALLGLDAGTRGLNSKARREIAADAFERTFETFRKNQEPLLLQQLAAQILVLSSEQHTRDARSALERAQTPEASAMPAVWLERFTAYYRMWSSINGLGADLTAYRATMIEAVKHYDRLIGTEGPDDLGYSQDEQAEGYATFALYHYAHFAWQLRQFITLHGGQWLLSDAKAEQDVADAVYRIWWHSPWNERDESYLRSLIAEAPGQEMHSFIERLRASELGKATEQQWFEWGSTCKCTWPPGMEADEEYFPTSQHHEGISEKCQVHNLVRACGDYLDLIDQDWKRLADWYHLSGKTNRGVSASELYERLPPDSFRSQTQSKDSENDDGDL